MHEEKTDILVVGAGPVGLLTALLLAEAGIEVRIIDQEERTAGRSYACALHPRTMQLLKRLGLAADALEQGRQISRLAFYDGSLRQAEINLAPLGGEFPFLVTLPQSAFENLLEQRLRGAGVTVQWNHRLEGFESTENAVVAGVAKLGGTSTGYIVPHWEMVVKQRSAVTAKFLVGADGRGSLVRQRAGIKDQLLSGPEFFAVYEFQPDAESEDEVRVVLDNTTTNVLWPLPGNRYRWSFQLLHSEVSSEFPLKDRTALRVAEPRKDETIRNSVQKLARNRAPWFSAGMKELAWCTVVEFEHRLADCFGQDRCWLVGDAAHQTGPVGMQSMNSGLCEAEDLTAKLQKILREDAPLESLNAYGRDHRAEWQGLLGLTSGLKPGSQTSQWTRERCARILPCLPASGRDLTRLASQLALDIAP
jgi:2-polyprenyl-6-methoxyphenol hydroxylase-like FAD-dependent oxidoreductase